MKANCLGKRRRSCVFILGFLHLQWCGATAGMRSQWQRHSIGLLRWDYDRQPAMTSPLFTDSQSSKIDD